MVGTSVGDDNKYGFYDPVTFEQKHEIFVPGELQNMIDGGTFGLNTLDGKDYFLLAQYEKVFVDESFQLTPDNFYILSLYDVDNNFSLRTELRIPIPDVSAESIPVYPMGSFGMFAGPEFDISKNIFNDDDKLEFLVAFAYLPVFGNTWYHYYVINEDGEVLKKYEKKAIQTDVTPMILNPIEGQDTQMAFIVADAEGNQSFEMLDIESWTEGSSFPVILPNGDQITFMFNRVANGDSYDYIIGLAANAVVKDADGTYYSMVKTYNKDTKEVTSEIKLNLGKIGINNYQVMFDKNTLNPTFFDTDNEMEFLYYYTELVNGVNGDTHLRIAKSGQEPILDVFYDSDLGKFTGSAGIFSIPYFTDKYLNIYYESGATALYKLPLVNGGNSIESQVADKSAAAYYDKTTQSIVVADNATDVVVYTVSGSAVYQGQANVIPVSAWAKGVYIVKAVADGKVSNAKVLVQ
ncbi:MAG: T9SS type A sorting domain-containing protein [Dysgonomonas sp.]